MAEILTGFKQRSAIGAAQLDMPLPNDEQATQDREAIMNILSILEPPVATSSTKGRRLQMQVSSKV
jgi:hypothetical protein